jgi:hypothetical protein
MIFFCLFASTSLMAQVEKKARVQKPSTNVLMENNGELQTESYRSTQKSRCGTAESIQKRMATDPVFRARMEEGKRQYEASKALIGSAAANARTSTLTNPVTIPVVVHIVLPDPSIVTDRDVLYLINRLNLDYSGDNPDSTNATSFYNVRGRSKLRWALAKRDVNGNPTTGIERKVGYCSIMSDNPQPVKDSLPAWDITKYFNIWVTDPGIEGILGIAPEIGPGLQTGTSIDGPVISYTTFSRNPCYSETSFNLGRTVVHEVGHCFGLYHPFDNGCSTDDFAQLSSAGCQLPANLLAPADDVPKQSAATSGCLSGNQASGCAASPNPPGKMYQNFMDYTDDACYSMFSKGSVARMEWVLENCRAGYLTSLGATFPASAAANNAAATDVVSPGGFEMTGTGDYTNPLNTNTFTCVTYNTPNVCSGTAITPKFRIANYGTANLTSVIANFQLNNGAVVSQNVSLNLAYMQDTVISFAPVTPVEGDNVFKFWTSSPNGAADGAPSNDTIRKYLSVASPFTEGFQGNVFPPNGWRRGVFNNGYQLDGITPQVRLPWQKKVGVGYNSNACIYMDNYNIDNVDQISDIFTPPIDISNSDSVKIEFYVASAYFDDGAGNVFMDTLQIGYSRNCGTNYFSAYKKWGAALSSLSVPGITTDYVPTSAADWRKETISLAGPGPGVSQKLILLIRNKGQYANNIYLDNFNVYKYNGNDIQVTAVNVTAPVNCGDNITPTINVKNNGFRAITGFKASYKLDANTSAVTRFTGLNIAPNGGTATGLALATMAVTTPGTHTVKAYNVDSIFTSSSGLDLDRSSDTATTSFTAAALPTPSITLSGVNGVSLVSSSATGNQWYLNGTLISGATGNTYTPTQNGNYTVQVTVNGCQSAVSSAYNYTITGVINIEPGLSVMVVPNPVSDNLYIKTMGQAGNLKLHARLSNLEGKIISSKAINLNDQINMSGLSAGVYMLELRATNKNMVWNVKIVKK